MMAVHNRNNGLDILKFICIVLEILAHTGALKNSFPVNLEPLCRFVVPIFFMITGFYYDQTEKRGRVMGQIKKVLLLIVIANVTLIVLNMAYCLINSESIIDWALSCFTKRRIFNMLLFNENCIVGHFGSLHIWYLNALLYVLIISAICRKLGIFKILFIIAPLLYIGGLVVEYFSSQLIGVNFGAAGYFFYYRNFMTLGIPYFCIGFLLNRYKDRFKWNNIVLMILSIVFIGITFLELYLSDKLSLSSNGEMFIVSPSCSVCVFLLFYNYYKEKRLNWFEKGISFSGRKYVVWIYIFNLPIIVLIMDIMSKLGFNDQNLIIVSILSLMVTLAISFGIDHLSGIIKNRT